MKEPPDKYKVIKCTFKKFVKEKESHIIIFDAVKRTHHLTINVYQLLRLWILDKYTNNLEIPIITTKTISIAYKSLYKGNRIPTNNDNKLLFTEFRNLYNFEKIDAIHLSGIIDYSKVSILTSIENNIKLHFFEYVKRYVNAYFKDLLKFSDMKTNEKKIFYIEISKIKQDLFNNTLESDSKYHQWITENRYNILPKEYIENYYYDIVLTPQKYIKHMIWMNIELEKKELKKFQFCPLRTDIIPKYIQIDAKAIKELLMKGDNNYSNLIKTRNEIWNAYFNTTLAILKDYSFDYSIRTDGYSVSIQMMKNIYLNKKEKTQTNKSNGSKKYNGLPKEEKSRLRKIDKEEQEANKLLITKKIKSTKKEEKKKKLREEFPYIDEVNKEELKGKRIFIDPGKNSLLTIMNNTNKFMTYSNAQRVRETKRMIYNKKIHNYRKSKGILDIEQELSKYDSKTCDLQKYKEYLEIKNKINKELFEKYEDEIYRKYKWYGYINKKRSEDKLLTRIAQKYGSDVKIIIGDYSVGKHMRGILSTPGISLKRKLKTRFKVFHIDEFRTSCLHYKTEKKCENLYLPDKKDKLRHMHSILTYKMENNRKGCINRDRNAVLNMQKIFMYYMKHSDRPHNYKRTTKDVNPSVAPGVK